MKILVNKFTGNKEDVPEGFSFTTLCFGIFVPLFRGDSTGFFIMLLCAIFSGGISWFFFPFFYNRMFEKSLRKQGYSDP